MRSARFVWKASAAAIVTTLTCSAPALADTVYTTDGSSIVGTIQEIHTGTLVLMSEVVGRLEIPMDKVANITTSGTVHIELDSGDTLQGMMEDLGADTSVMRSEVGDVAAPPGKIVMLWPEGAKSPRERVAREKAEAELEAAKPKWTVTLEAGFQQKEGNSETIDARGQFHAKRKTSDDLLHFYARANYSEEDNKRSDNEYIGGVLYENSLTERWFGFVRGELEYDEFEDIDLRATVSMGPGYYWIKRDHQDLKTRMGLGYRHETHNNGTSNDDLILDLGLAYRLDIYDWAQFVHSTKYSPDFEDFDDYLIDADTTLVIPLKKDQWKWKLGIRNEYNAQPGPGKERLDNTYYSSIVLELK